jgi:hypothetical protein
MTWTTLQPELLLSGTWQMAPASEGSLYRFSYLSGDLGPTGIARYEVGQFDTDGSGYGLRTFRTELFGQIVVLKKPAFFDTQRLGLRYPAGFAPFTLKIEVNDMPLSQMGNASSATNSLTKTVAASTTMVTIVEANPDRKMLSILNGSSKSLFLDFDNDVQTNAFAVEVKASVFYEMPVGFAGEVKGIWAAGATGSCKVVEFF